MQGKSDTSRSQHTSVSEDPTAWVLETYPWSQPAHTPLTRLKPLGGSDSLGDQHMTGSQSSPNGCLRSASSDGEDRLVSLVV